MLGSAKNLKESDSALMMSFAAGDPQGFELLYQRHSHSIYRFFYFGTHGDSVLTSELFQDVWMTVVRGRVRYTQEINFNEWLHHSAWARLHDHLRLHTLDREANEKPVREESTVVNLEDYVNTGVKQESDELPDEQQTDNKSGVQSITPADVNKRITGTALLESIKNLNPEHKEVVLLRYCFSMNTQEIADFVDLNKSIIDKIFREAAAELRRELSANHLVVGE